MYIPTYYKTYFFTFYGEPQNTVVEYNKISSGYIQCFIKAQDVNDAIDRATLEIKRNKWNIQDLYYAPVELPNGVFPPGTEYINVAKSVEETGSGFLYVGISRDGKSYKAPFNFQRNDFVDNKSFFNKKRKILNRKECLHFNAGPGCNSIIKSHSIQNHHQLDTIARNSHVYTINFDNPRHMGTYTLKGIKEMSTFHGFCGKHDNELFHPIDDYPFSDSGEQAMLYAYRALCKEIYTKQNAYQLVMAGYESISNEESKDDLRCHVIGQYSGLCSLKKAKNFYDNSLRLKNYSDAHYLLFIISGKMNIVFSSLIEPDYDFSGNILQDLGDLSKDLQLITYSSVWISDVEWGFLFSWHKEYDEICLKYIGNLLEKCYKLSDFNDYLFRLTIVCENSAFSPDWWEALSEQQRVEITDYSNNIIDLFSKLRNDYLVHGLERICDWHISSIKTNVKELKGIINSY